MNYKDKFLAQCVICFLIFAIAEGSTMITHEGFTKIKDEIVSRAGIHNSLEDIKEAGAKAIDIVLGAPAVLTGAVMEANKINEYAAPIDEKTEEQIQPVYASAGGVVMSAGIDKDYGSCIIIKHQGKTSTYGNLYTLSVVPGERVTRGQIIGTFDNNCGEDFYYQLVDNVI